MINGLLLIVFLYLAVHYVLWARANSGDAWRGTANFFSPF